MILDNFMIDMFKEHIYKLHQEVYEQPEDPGHKAWAQAFISWCMSHIGRIDGSVIPEVLDLGCGQGFTLPMFASLNMNWRGGTLGKDYQVCKEKGLPVEEWDISFIPVQENTYDVLFARHILEHSPMPVITLMEWNRIAKKGAYLWLCLPTPEYWNIRGGNHYSVFNRAYWYHYFEISNWLVVDESSLDTNQKLYMDFYMPEIKEPQQRADLHFPGHPIPVEYWFLLRKPLSE